MVADNPLMRAAASLLLALGRLRASLSRAGAGPLMDQVAQAIEASSATRWRPARRPIRCRPANTRSPPPPTTSCRTCRPTTATSGRAIRMLVRFFGERTGGVKFFQELDRAKQNPAVNLGLLELMHACLSLGFEGVYRAAGGMGALQGLRRDLYETIRRARAEAHRGPVAALARADHRARGQPAANSGLGGGRGGRRCCCSASICSCAICSTARPRRWR